MLEDLQGTFEIDGEILPSAPDLIWLYGKSLNKQLMQGWNGFMEQVSDGLEFSRSKILFLPFIRAPPTDYNTVFTSLMEVSNQSTAHGQKITFVTFDQPLFIKARDIVESGHHPELNSVVVRLGGFHLLLSFMGCIGTIMGGSGLKELLTTIYAGQSVDKIMNGHAYSRAVRAHILTNLTLASIVFDEVNMTPVERDEIENLLRGTERSLILSPEEIDSYQMLKGKFKSALKKIEANGPTSELWVQYFRMTTLIKLFIQAERAGDWNLHLYTVHKMLPFFHAAGHFLYAKSAHLYLQDMMALQDRMDKCEYDMFTKGSFTIRRSDKFWSGLWSDLTIEQKLMRSMKTYGGLTQGRGISDSVLARWTTGMVFMVNICEELESFCRISCPTGEQHVDMRPSRIIRDNNDVEKLKTWFALHPPFPKTDSLLSISSGLLAGPEINCHTAQKVGTEGVMKIVGQMYDKVVIKRKNKVLTLASITSSVKLPDKTRRVAVDPLTIFQRVCIAKQSEQDLQDDFKYELAPYPMSLFNEQGMRKGTKSTLYSAFTPLSSPKPIDASTHVVLDGGYLLHKVVWQRKTTVQALLVRYITYVRGHFGKNVSIVFDGYPEDATNKNTKTAERLRRYVTHSSYELTFEESTVIQIAQENVLGNENNKRRLITLLCDAFQKEGVEVAVAEEDADREIVMTALSKAAVSDRVVIVGEDVDLLVLLNGLGAEKKNVYLQKSSKGETGFCHYSTTSYNHKTSPGTILFTHAFTGCDTTSALFGQGKTKITTLLSKNESLTEQVEVFLRPNSTPEVVKESGIKFFVALYGGDITKDTLDYFRYKSFITSTSINLARLPPTQDAAGHHAARCYLQVQKWRGVNLNPTDWGWKLSSQGLIPITTTMDPAPPALLRKISCKCKKGCSGGCSCRKAGLHCSVLCQSCGGQTCNNIPDVEIRCSDDEEDPTTDWAPLPASIETPSSCNPKPGPSKIKRKL